MQNYAFRLNDRASNAFQGVVVVFATDPQEVWCRLATDDEAQQIPGMVMSIEAGRLGKELEALTEGTEIPGGPSLLWQMFSDPVFGADSRATFIGRHTFSMIVRTEDSFRRQVDRWYRNAAPAP